MKTYHMMTGLIMLFVVTQNSIFAQESQRVRVQVPPSGGYRMLTENGKTIIPFELISNHVVIPAAINGKPLKLILDTGMPIDGGLLFGKQSGKDLGLQVIGKAPIMGVGGNPIESDLTMGVTFNLPGVEFTNQMVLVMPQDSARSNHFEGKDGVIGHTLFSRFVVRIDYDKMEITLTEPDRFEYRGSGRELPLRIDRYPFLICEADIGGSTKIPLELVVDTGNGAALTLNVGAQEGLVLPEKVIETHTRSVGHEITRLMGRIGRLQLGPYVLQDLLSSFRTSDHEPPPPWEKGGAVGQGILYRFNVVFDYAHKKIILEPNTHFDEPFEFNMAGIQFIRSVHGSFQINRVIPDSPASEAGLQVGDHIIQIDGQPTNQMSVDDAEQLLKRESQEVILDIRRGMELHQLRLKLRRLI